MERRALSALNHWRTKKRRKPLIMRGARQVGKTTLVRLLAQRFFDHFVEINFERDPALAELFHSNHPTTILSLLEVQVGRAIIPGQTLLFLDEIQATPEVLGTLRYFQEELPALHIIAAGSLLELALERPTFSVPVGRIEYFYLGPMTFDEFLQALDQNSLVQFMDSYQLGDPLPAVIHTRLSTYLKRYLVLGGMPESIAAYAESGSFLESESIKHAILDTFRDDFGKYGPRIDTERLRMVFARLPRLVGTRVKYTHIDRDARSAEIAAALNRLAQAQLVYAVRRSAANGIPLGAEASPQNFKIIFLDVGLLTTAVGLNALDLEPTEDTLMIHRGMLAEQFVGQHLLYDRPSWEPLMLHYWSREKKGASSEVDYVLSHRGDVVPIEVKAGKTGRLKSLHVFLREKQLELGVRFNSEPPSLLAGTTSISRGPNVPFTLLSLPLYMIGQLRRFLPSVLSRG